MALPAPNPTTGEVTLTFERGGSQPLDAEVLDTQGRVIRRLAVTAPEGLGLIRWDGRVEGGLPAAAGTYYLRLRSGSATAARPLVLLR